MQFDGNRRSGRVASDLNHLVFFKSSKRFFQVGRQAFGREDEFATEKLRSVSHDTAHEYRSASNLPEREKRSDPRGLRKKCADWPAHHLA